MKVSCHCGNIEITLRYSPNEVGQCNCSICRRYAALWAYYSPQDVTIKYFKQQSVFYIWGDKQVEFHRCNLCGCITHYVTTKLCDEDIVAVNIRMADAKILSAIPIRKIDGASY